MVLPEEVKGIVRHRGWLKQQEEKKMIHSGALMPAAGRGVLAGYRRNHHDPNVVGISGTGP
jgi:hypothetical protein